MASDRSETTTEEVRGPDAFWLGIIAEKDAEIARLRAALRRIAHDRPAYRGEDEVFRLARARKIAREASHV